MTTAFFDPSSRALYVDSQSTMGTLRYSTSCPKFRIIEHHTLGTCIAVASGAISYTEAVLETFRTGEPIPRIPDDESISILMLTEDNELYEASTPDLYVHRTRDQSALIAIGSGLPFAYAAYAATGCPEKTMEIVKQLDLYTGGNTVRAYFDTDKNPIIEDLTSL